MAQDDELSKLKDAIGALADALRVLDATSLESVTGLVFARYLDYKPQAAEQSQAKLAYDAQKVAAFIFVNQVFFYHALSHADPQFSLLTASPHLILDLQDKFSNMIKSGFAPIFAPDIASLLPEDDQIIAAINSLLSLGLEDTLRGMRDWTHHFAKLIPQEIRKHLAAFYTSEVGAQLLADLSIHSPRDTIADLACGTGTLLVHAYERKQVLLKLKSFPSSNPDLEIHHQLLSDLYGNDVLPFATQLTAMNLALRDPLFPAPPIHITAGDGFQVQGVPHVDVVLMNPPFTRHERIAPEFSQAIEDKLAEEGYKEYVAGKMSLQHFFLFHADNFLKPGGRLAFVLPANTFNVDLSEKLIRFLIDKRYHVEYLVAVNSRTGAFSEDCNYKEYLLVATKGTLTDASQTFLVVFSALPALANVGIITDLLSASNKSITFERDGIKVDVKCINTRQLYSADKWDPAFWDLNNPDLLLLLTQSTILVPLNHSEEFTFVTGFHSTHCDSLIIPNRLFQVVGEMGIKGLEIERRSDGRRLVIPKEFLRPCLREAKQYRGIYATARHWVLSVDRLESLPLAVQQDFIDYTSDVLQKEVWEKSRKGGKVRERLEAVWFTHPHKTGCNTKVGHCWTFNRYGMWRRSNAAIYTDITVTGNDGFHIYDYTGTEMNKEEALQLLTSWFNTSLHLYDFLRKCRVPATHVQQCLKPDRELMFVPQVKAFTAEDRRLLLNQTQIFNQNLHGTILEQLKGNARRTFDDTWLQILGVPQKKVSEILDKLYLVLNHVIAVR